MLPEEAAEKKAEILEKMEWMEDKLAHPDFDDIIRETDDSLSGGLKTAHEMNGKAGTTGAQYCFLFRRIHSLLDVIKADGRVAGAMDKIKEYDAGHGKILKWEETAEGWKNEYMTIPDDDSVVKGWGVSKPYQMRIFCETAKREVIREAVRHLGDFEPEEQRKIAEQAFSEVSKSTHRGVDIHFEKDTAAIVVKMASAEEYILSCAFYGTGEWRYPEASVQEAYEEALRIYREIHEKQDQIERTVDVKELFGFAQGMKRSFSEGLIPEECYNRFVQMGRDVLKQADSLAEGNAAYGLYVEYAVKHRFDESDYVCPKTREHVEAVLELMEKTFALFPEFKREEQVYSFYPGRLEGVGEERGREDYGGVRGR